MIAPAKNPFTWVEIYVDDMDRARKFYETTLQITMIPMDAPGDDDSLQMIGFPWSENGLNISGALCKSDDFQPGPGGTIVYFTCDDCAVEAARVEGAGGQIIQNKFQIGEFGFIAMIMDTEGNILGLHSTK